jgi:hypothetical protein
MVRSEAGQLSGSPSWEVRQHRSRSRRPQSPPPGRNVAKSKRRSSQDARLRPSPEPAMTEEPIRRTELVCAKSFDSSLTRNLRIATSKRARGGNLAPAVVKSVWKQTVALGVGSQEISAFAGGQQGICSSARRISNQCTLPDLSLLWVIGLSTSRRISSAKQVLRRRDREACQQRRARALFRLGPRHADLRKLRFRPPPPRRDRARRPGT